MIVRISLYNFAIKNFFPHLHPRFKASLVARIVQLFVIVFLIVYNV